MTTWGIGRLVVIAAILGAVIWIVLPDGGEAEFQRSIGALKQVRSVRYVETADPSATYHSERRGELSCEQDAYHETLHLISADARIDDEQYRSGKSEYIRHGDGPWGYSGFLAKPGEICSYLAYGMRNDIFPDYGGFLAGKIEKGGKKDVNGVTCREWKVTLPDFGPAPQSQGKGGDVPAGDAKLHYTVCIATDSHLPLEMTAALDNSRWTYSDFNTPIDIERPALPASLITN
jgi:hypothetical protein